MIEVGVKQGGKIKVRTRKKPYYTKEEFEEAVKGVRKASLMYCVPRATCNVSRYHLEPLVIANLLGCN